MDKKGYELNATTLMTILTIVVFVLAFYIVVKNFIDFSVTDMTHELNRKLDEAYESILTNCSLLHSPGVFDPDKLDEAVSTDSLTERCFRFCDVGMLMVIRDDTGKRWRLGYVGPGYSDETRSSISVFSSFPVAIYYKDGASALSCPASQSCTYTSESECTNNCCIWSWDAEKCEACSEIKEETACKSLTEQNGACMWNVGTLTCEYTGTFITSWKKPGTLTLYGSKDLLTKLSCAIDRAKETGKTQTIYVENSPFYDAFVTSERTIKISGEPGKVVITVPVKIGGGETTSDIRYERKLYSGSTGTTEIKLTDKKGYTAIHVSSTGTITYEFITGTEE